VSLLLALCACVALSPIRRYIGTPLALLCGASFSVLGHVRRFVF